MTNHTRRGHHLATGQGEAIWFMDTLMTVKASGRDTDDALSVVEALCPAGFGPPPHLHHREDEAFYVLEGQMTVTCGEQTWTATPGSVRRAARGIPHAFTVAATRAVPGADDQHPGRVRALRRRGGAAGRAADSARPATARRARAADPGGKVRPRVHFRASGRRGPWPARCHHPDLNCSSPASRLTPPHAEQPSPPTPKGSMIMSTAPGPQPRPVRRPPRQAARRRRPGQPRLVTARVLGFQPELDFVEDGTLMGVGLSHPGGLRVGLRCDRDRIAALAGFDLLALAVPGRAELDAWLAHLDALGVPHGPVMHGHHGDVVAVHDPDGIQIRLYTTDPPDP